MLPADMSSNNIRVYVVMASTIEVAVGAGAEMLVRKKDPGAEHFYLVHEYGHIALATASEAEADCWAARELAKARNGERYLNAAIRHFMHRPDQPSARYGSPRRRAERIRDCAAM